jgi:DNA mismatch repair protein MSH3
MDELGRGTATHDGVSIACATLSHLVANTRCLSLFVTHYPEVAALAQHQAGAGSGSGSDHEAAAAAMDPIWQHAAAYHMAYARRDPAGSSRGSNGSGDAGPTITFLYKLAVGAADASFGLNVAQVRLLAARGMLQSVLG